MVHSPEEKKGYAVRTWATCPKKRVDFAVT